MANLIDMEDVKIYSLSELEKLFREVNISQEQIRFFVNVNSKEKECFGVYQDINSGDFIVYKNKDDGTRFIRYQGSDEKEAVSIFFDKLKEEMVIRDAQGLYANNEDQQKMEIVLGIVDVADSVLEAFFPFHKRQEIDFKKYEKQYGKYCYSKDDFFRYDFLSWNKEKTSWDIDWS